MSNEPFDLLDGDQPIPLAPAATACSRSKAPPAVEMAAAALVHDAGVEQPPAPTPATVVVELEVVPAMASTTPVPAINPAPPPASSRPAADPLAEPDGHPLTGVRWFRLESIHIDPADRWRGALGPSLVRFVLAIAFVDALILAFALLLAHFTVPV